MTGTRYVSSCGRVELDTLHITQEIFFCTDCLIMEKSRPIYGALTPNSVKNTNYHSSSHGTDIYTDERKINVISKLQLVRFITGGNNGNFTHSFAPNQEKAMLTTFRKLPLFSISYIQSFLSGHFGYSRKSSDKH